jgi:hypothetical protein
MPTNTSDQQIPLPVDADPADAPVFSAAMTAVIEGRLVKRYVNLADRTARNPSPTAGEMSYLTTEARWDRCITGGGSPVWWEAFPFWVRKTAETQVVNNSTVFISDTHLLLPLVANARYELSGYFLWDSGTTGDIKFQWIGPAGFTVPLWGVTAPDTALAFGNGFSQAAANAVARGGAGIGTFVAGLLYGEVVTAGTAGNLQLQWAQNAAEAVNTRMKQESWMKLIRVG